MGIKANFRLTYQKAFGVCHFSALMFAMESHGFAFWFPSVVQNKQEENQGGKIFSCFCLIK